LRRRDFSGSFCASHFGKICSGRQTFQGRWNGRPDTENTVLELSCTSRDRNRFPFHATFTNEKFILDPGKIPATEPCSRRCPRILHFFPQPSSPLLASNFFQFGLQPQLPVKLLFLLHFH